MNYYKASASTHCIMVSLSLAMTIFGHPNSGMICIVFEKRQCHGHIIIRVKLPSGVQKLVRVCCAVFVMLMRRNPEMRDKLLRSARQGQTCPLTSQAFFECLYKVDARFVQSVDELERTISGMKSYMG